jgi:hypothetical protein
VSKTIFEGTSVSVTSFCGPANTIERTRMRLQIEVTARDGIASLGFNEISRLHDMIGRWLYEQNKDHR